MMNLYYSLILMLFLLSSCNNSELQDNSSLNYKYYLYDTLKLNPNKTGIDYFIILNPKSSCTACYLGSIEKAWALKSKYKIKFITNYNLSRFLNGKDLETIVDDECKFSNLDKQQSLNSKLLIFKNKELVFDKSLNMLNIDSIENYLKNLF